MSKFIEIYPLYIHQGLSRKSEYDYYGVSKVSTIINMDNIIEASFFPYIPEEYYNSKNIDYLEGRRIFLANGETYEIGVKDTLKIKSFLEKTEKIKGNNCLHLNKRLNLLITERLYKDLKDISRFDGQSINNTINKVLGEYISKRSEDIKDIRGLKG